VRGEAVTPFFKPFYYLQFDGFWHLKGKTDNVKTDRPSPKFLRENIDYAYLDNALWDLLQEASIREHFKLIIESHHLK
jgi:putative restriction endonuclease